MEVEKSSSQEEKEEVLADCRLAMRSGQACRDDSLWHARLAGCIEEAESG